MMNTVPDYASNPPDCVISVRRNAPHPGISDPRCSHPLIEESRKGGRRIEEREHLMWDLKSLAKHWPESPQVLGVSWFPFFLRADPSLPPGNFTFDGGGHGKDQIYCPRGFAQEIRIGKKYAYRIWFDYSRLVQA